MPPKVPYQSALDLPPRKTRLFLSLNLEYSSTSVAKALTVLMFEKASSALVEQAALLS